MEGKGKDLEPPKRDLRTRSTNQDDKAAKCDEDS